MSTKMSQDMSPEQYDDAIYATYLEFGGKIERDRFDKMKTVFLVYTLNTFTSEADIEQNIRIEADLRGVSCREVAVELWLRFVKKIGHTEQDAVQIFQAIDAFEPADS